MNKTMLFGRVGRDPEIKYFDSGKCKATFSLATSNGKDKDGQYRPSDWHNIECWEKTAELVAQYVKKGTQLLIVGPSKVNEYEKDGEKKRFNFVLCNELHFGPKASESAGETRGEMPGGADKLAAQIDEDDIPF